MAEFTVSRVEESTAVALKGRLERSDIARLRQALSQEIGSGSKSLRIDLSGVDSLDTAGIGLLLAAGNSLSAMQGSYSLINAPPDIGRLLAAMGLAGMLQVAEATKGSGDGGE